ncbi:hypothetical protein [Roseomonas sp. HF4]|uniref:hypothetical protein n=1 Tax=Roseomonas sp. HF4 TaxID=2562313 RepID=UPI0010C0D9C8|nr:hypothetical protein [Roseomonas sp. HF4]
MTLRRTASGLRSLHVFFRADVVVFCEGGPSITYNEALATDQTDGTLDTHYWSSVLSIFPNGRRCHFKSIGCKETLKKIQLDINNLNISTITICRDQDFDLHLNRTMPCARTAYTFGYSWENDVVQLPILFGLIDRLAGGGEDGSAMKEALREKLLAFSGDIKSWVEVDIALHARNKLSIFDRGSPLFCIDLQNCPSVKHDKLRERLSSIGYQRSPRKVKKFIESEVILSCFGKLVSRTVYHCVSSMFLSLRPSVKMTYNLFMRMLIGEAVAALRASSLPEYHSHLQHQSSALA